MRRRREIVDWIQLVGILTKRKAVVSAVSFMTVVDWSGKI
jgi:hypothetical protein